MFATIEESERYRDIYQTTTVLLTTIFIHRDNLQSISYKIRDQQKTMSTLLSCSKCCSVFSFAAIIFLMIVASLLHTQPLYIKGPSSPSEASKACYNAALIYFAVFLISLAYWAFSDKKTKGTTNQEQKSKPNYGSTIDEDDTFNSD